jgi:hypothetical protein
MQRPGRVAELAITLLLAGTLAACSETGRAAASSHDATVSADVADGEKAERSTTAPMLESS